MANKTVRAKKKQNVKSASRAKSAPSKAVKQTRAAGASPTRSKRIASKAVSNPLLNFKTLNYPRIEQELHKLGEILKMAQDKSNIVKQSVAYLEKEQKVVVKQMAEAKKYFGQIKTRGINALKSFPDNTEDFLQQLRKEWRKLSSRLGF